VKLYGEMMSEKIGSFRYYEATRELYNAHRAAALAPTDEEGKVDPEAIS